MAEQQYVTIPRVAKTPELSVSLRGRVVQALQPQPGSVLLVSDNGFSTCIGSKESFVVTEVTRVKKTGTVTQVFTHAIVSLDDETVTCDPARGGPAPKLYASEGWVRWDEEASHSLHGYTFDKYSPTVEGDYNK